jgi:hypothetical protein
VGLTIPGGRLQAAGQACGEGLACDRQLHRRCPLVDVLAVHLLTHPFSPAGAKWHRWVQQETARTGPPRLKACPTLRAFHTNVIKPCSRFLKFALSGKKLRPVGQSSNESGPYARNGKQRLD